MCAKKIGKCRLVYLTQVCKSIRIIVLHCTLANFSARGCYILQLPHTSGRHLCTILWHVRYYEVLVIHATRDFVSPAHPNPTWNLSCTFSILAKLKRERAGSLFDH